MWETNEKLRENGVLLYNNEFSKVNLNEKCVLACFDLDNTLICPKSTRKFAKDADDYRLLYSNIVDKLKKSVSNGEKIVIFSNQGWNDLGKINMFKEKVENMTKGRNAIFHDIPFLLCAATEPGLCRKPQIGMFQYVLDQYVPIVDMEKSYYVGDMAGRETDPNDTDRTFALNARLKFYTPEEYFFETEPVPYKLKLDLANIAKTDAIFVDEMNAHVKCIAESDCLILLVGRPASGKSHFYSEYLKPLNFEHVNQDTLKTKDKCIKAVKDTLKSSEIKKIVVDNTNPSKKVRNEYITLAKNANIPVYVFNFTTSHQLSQHNNMYRSIHEGGKRVPDIAYRIYDKNFEKPEINEGISKVIDIDFHRVESMEKWDEYYI